MKTLFKALPWVLVAVLAAGYFFPGAQKAPTQDNEKEIQQIHSDRDSLTRVIELKNDTLAAIRGRVESAEFQVMKARKENKKLIKEKNEIYFVSYDSANARFNQVARLYPSLYKWHSSPSAM